MELDDFRRRWQEQPVELTQSSLTEQKLRAMLTAPDSTNPLIRLKKNASRELRLLLVGLVLLIFDAVIFFRHEAKMQLLAGGVFFVMCLVGLIVYQRLKLIRQMEQQQSNLYHFLKIRIVRLRQLMRLHDYVGMVALVLLAVFVVLVRRADLWAYLRPDQANWGWHWGAVGAGTGVALAFIYVAYLIGKLEQQRRYGRYLDQLEGALRELEA